MSVLTKISATHFNNAEDFEGWNCGKITSCGAFGNVCGGYDVKAKGHEIKKTFMLPEGTYLVAMDFIRIDTWFVLDVVFELYGDMD